MSVEAPINPNHTLFYEGEKTMAKAYRIIPTLTPIEQARFWSAIDQRGPNDCWPWKRGPHVKQKSRYGRINLQGREWRAHRLAFLLAYNTLPFDALICHRCDNPPCCNPAHLFIGTTKDNTRDALKKGRMRRLFAAGQGHWSFLHPDLTMRGERNGHAKLTASQVSTIRLLMKHGAQGKELAVRYGVSRRTISNIVQRDSWRHVK